MLTIETDEGVTGHYFGGGSHGDAEGLNVVDQQLILWPHQGRCWSARIRSTAR